MSDNDTPSQEDPTKPKGQEPFPGRFMLEYDKQPFIDIANAIREQKSQQADKENDIDIDLQKETDEQKRANAIAILSNRIARKANMINSIGTVINACIFIATAILVVINIISTKYAINNAQKTLNELQKEFRSVHRVNIYVAASYISRHWWRVKQLNGIGLTYYLRNSIDSTIATVDSVKQRWVFDTTEINRLMKDTANLRKNFEELTHVVRADPSEIPKYNAFSKSYDLGIKLRTKTDSGELVRLHNNINTLYTEVFYKNYQTGERFKYIYVGRMQGGEETEEKITPLSYENVYYQDNIRLEDQ
jgi:hypothetical protein